MKITAKTDILDIACVVCEALSKSGISAFLSGGAVVTIYSENRYQSYDLDFISHGDFKKITEVMTALGFTREKGRHFIHPASAFYIEFPGVAAAIGDEPIQEFAEIKRPAGLLKLLTPTYCVMDRLSAYYHWSDEQSLEQAVLVAQTRPVNLRRVREWSKREGMGEKLKIFEARMSVSKLQVPK